MNEVAAVLDKLASSIDGIDLLLEETSKRRQGDVDSQLGREQDELMRAIQSEFAQVRGHLQDALNRLEKNEGLSSTMAD